MATISDSLLATEYGHLEEMPQGFALPKDNLYKPIANSAYAHQRILLLDDIMDEKLCQAICQYIEVTYQHMSKPGAEMAQYRSAFVAPYGNMHPIVNAIIYRALIDYIEPFFGATVEWWERPQLLRYGQGGKYDPHSDSERWNKGENNSGQGFWEREHDRDISILLYLNNNFTGGKLLFPQHQFRLSPKPGLLAAFPSTHHYRHGAEPTESGIRYVIVSWAATIGSRRVRQKQLDTNVYMSEFKGYYGTGI